MQTRRRVEHDPDVEALGRPSAHRPKGCNPHCTSQGSESHSRPTLILVHMQFPFDSPRSRDRLCTCAGQRDNRM